ncbi:hypothetical protein Ancab_034774 [Ancistrocladus abbreviatus]
MATLQKFKLLATQCAVAGSPTRSPTTSPVIHLRRRRTLRMFLSRSNSNNSSGRRFHRREEEASDNRQRMADKSTENNKEQLRVRHKLKDLFISSPPPLGENGKKKIEDEEDEIQRLLPATGRTSGVKEWGGGLAMVPRRGGSTGSLRPLSATLRQRLLRRAWRPVLVAIPEQSP